MEGLFAPFKEVNREGSRGLKGNRRFFLDISFGKLTEQPFEKQVKHLNRIPEASPVKSEIANKPVS